MSEATSSMQKCIKRRTTKRTVAKGVRKQSCQAIRYAEIVCVSLLVASVIRLSKMTT